MRYSHAEASFDSEGSELLKFPRTFPETGWKSAYVGRSTPLIKCVCIARISKERRRRLASTRDGVYL